MSVVFYPNKLRRHCLQIIQKVGAIHCMKQRWIGRVTRVCQQQLKGKNLGELFVQVFY
jgi:hypothetical protein